MRIRVIFRLLNRGASLPFHHQHLLSSIIRKVVQQTELKNERLSYNFSGLKGQTKVSREGLHYFSKKVTLVLSSPDKTFVDTFLEHLFSYDIINIGNLTLAPEYVEQEVEPKLVEETKYVCISPLVISCTDDAFKNKSFYRPESEIFSDLLFESTFKRMRDSGNYSAEELQSFSRFEIQPDKRYLARLQREEKKFARIYTAKHNGEFVEVRGYTFPFTLYAAEEVHKFIFRNGFGELTLNGFGMVDVANSKLSGRTEPYNFKEDIEAPKTLSL